jgi:tetratricopeptide (TPR) repeat protein
MDRTRNFLYVFLLVVVAFGVYANSFRNEFVWDCDTLILKWYEIRSLKNIPSLLKGNVPVEHGGVYRPLRGVFYALNYQFWGKDPFGYHFNALLIHLSATILIYFIILAIGKNQTLAFMGALLFDVHPVHTEAITYVVASFDVIGLVFFLLSFYLYLVARRGEWQAKSGLAYGASLIFAISGFFTYEMVLTLPLILLIYDFCFKRIGQPLRYKFYLPYVFSALVYVLIRVFLIGVRGRGEYFEGSFYLTLLTMSKALLKYVSLSILPVGLNVNHALPRGIFSLLYAENCAEAVRSQSVLDGSVIVSIVVVVVLLSIALKARRSLPVVSFCILWFFITLFPVSNIIPFQNVMSERYLYLPSAGSCFLTAYLIFGLMNLCGRRGRAVGLVMFVSLALFYAGATCVRNKDWKDKVSLWSATLKEIPQSAMAHMNLGAAYISRGELEKAISHSLRAIELKPDNPKAYNNMAIAYCQLGKLHKSVEYYLMVLRQSPRYYKAYNNLGLAYGALGEYEKEIECYKKALMLKPSFIMARYNLGLAYYAKGLYEPAGDEWTQILELDPENVPAREALASLKDTVDGGD